jgi:hypothetical protein
MGAENKENRFRRENPGNHLWAAECGQPPWGRNLGKPVQYRKSGKPFAAAASHPAWLLWLTTAWSDLWKCRPPATTSPPAAAPSSSSSLSSSTCRLRSSSLCTHFFSIFHCGSQQLQNRKNFVGKAGALVADPFF